jgi:hypothetical protein
MALKNISVFLIKGRKNYKKNIRKNGTIRKKGGNMDKYTKFILTMIAVALFGINYHMFSGEIISSAKASHGGNVHKIALCNKSGSKCADISSDTKWGDTHYWLAAR